MHHPRISPPGRWPFALSVLLLFAGCSTLTHYTERIAPAIQSYESGRLEDAYKWVEKRADSRLDRLVYTLEAALIHHTQGHLEESNEEFSRAESFIREQEQKALISASGTAQQAASLLVNEKTLPYSGEPFEKVLLNSYKALNYLLLRQYEDARVEIRRTFARQVENRERLERELQALERRARSERLDLPNLYNQVYASYGDQSHIASRISNLYEDAFAYYLSALVYMLNGEFNDAYIDLKKACSLRPGIPWLEADLLEAARRSGLHEERRQWEKTFGRKAPEPAPGRGRCIVVFECGMAPRKTEVRIPLYVPNVGMVTLAFPKYEILPNRIDHAAILSRDGTLIGTTSVLTDIEATAIRSLSDKMPVLVIKQMLRAAAKGAIQKTAADNAGLAGALAANLYSAVTEQADLRSWVTLPGNIQVLSLDLPAGRHDLVLAARGPGGYSVETKQFTIDIAPDRWAFVDVRATSSRIVSLRVY